MKRLCALILAGSLLAACGGDDNDDVDTSSSSSTSSTVTTVAGDTTTTAAAAGGATATTAKGGSTATTARGVTAATAAGNAAPTPARPGTYDYRQSGTSTIGSVPPMGTLAVDAPSNGVQVWHNRTDPSGPPTDIFYAFRSNGPFITRTIVRQAGQTVDCTFDQPVPAPPWPHTVGKTITGHATCGAITVDVTGSITGTRKYTIDGASIDVVVVQTTVTTKGQINSTSNDIEWWAPSLRLAVHSETHTKGTFGAFAFESNITTDLVSGKPR